MKSGGVLFLVVELQPKDGCSHKIFYRLLPPILLKTLIKRNKDRKNIKIQLRPIPNDNKRFEIEIKDFVYESLKQQSYIDKPTLRLENVVDKDKPTTIITSFTTKESGDFAWQITLQPIYLYKQTPFADIPIEDNEFLVTVKNGYSAPVSVEGVVYFDKYYLNIGYGFVDIIVDECMELHTPKQGFEEGFKGTFSLKYKYAQSIDECIQKMRFLAHAISSNCITLGDYKYPLCIEKDFQGKLLKDIRHNLSVYEDMKSVWALLHVESPLNLSCFDEEGLNQLCNLVNYVYRKNHCALINDALGQDSTFCVINVGKYRFLFYMQREEDRLFSTIDAFNDARFQVVPIHSKGTIIPLLSLAIRKYPDCLFDNIDYCSQLYFYKMIYKSNHSFGSIVKEDIEVLSKLVGQETVLTKRDKVQWFINELSQLLLVVS